MKIMCSPWRHLPRWLIGGLLYGLIEIAYRGHTHWTMVVLAMALCIPLDIANEFMPWLCPCGCKGCWVG